MVSTHCEFSSSPCFENCLICSTAYWPKPSVSLAHLSAYYQQLQGTRKKLTQRWQEVQRILIRMDRSVSVNHRMTTLKIAQKLRSSSWPDAAFRSVRHGVAMIHWLLTTRKIYWSQRGNTAEFERRWRGSFRHVNLAILETWYVIHVTAYCLFSGAPSGVWVLSVYLHVLTEIRCWWTHATWIDSSTDGSTPLC